MIPMLHTRSNDLEIMDTQPLTEIEMRKTLQFLTTTNKYFGGHQVVLNHLNQWSKNWKKDEDITILDIGCGAGDIPIAISKWAKANNHSVCVLGIDLVPDIVSIAQKNTHPYANIHIQEKNFFDLLKEGRKFDYVVASLFLHHTISDETQKALWGMDKLADRGLLISDLVRSTPSYVAVASCSLLLGNSIVRHDGPLSVRRSFTTKELKNLAEESGLSYLKVKKEPWFRLSLSGEKI